MINPDDMPANSKPEPDGNTPGLRIVQSVRKTHAGFAKQVAIISMLAREVLFDVPDADFIEVRAIRYDKEDSSGPGTSGKDRQAPPWPKAEGSDGEAAT